MARIRSGSENDPKMIGMVKEASSFKSMKITLSEEALDLLEDIKEKGCFRSHSMAIEESIRALHDVLTHLDQGMAFAKDEKPIPDAKKLEVIRDIAVRLSRFSVYRYLQE